MGQKCSTNKTKKIKKNPEILYQAPKETFIVDLPRSKVAKKPLIYPKCRHFYMINSKTTVDTAESSIVWRKNQQKCRRLEYICESDRLKGVSCLTKSPSSGKYLKEIFIEVRMKMANHLRILPQNDLNSDLKRFTKLLEASTGINKLTLLFKDVLIWDRVFGYICEPIKRMPYLKYLKIDISECSLLTHEAISYLIKSLKRCKILEYFELDISRWLRLDEKIYRKLGNCLKRLKTLKSVCLKCQEYFELKLK